MHQPQTTRGAEQLAQAVGDLGVVVAGHGLDDDAHGPAVPGADVRAAGGVEHRAPGVVRVGLAEDEVARVGVDGRVGCEAEVRDAEERGEVGVVLGVC